MVEQAAAAAREKERLYWLTRSLKPVARSPLIELLSRRGTLDPSASRLDVREWSLPPRVCDDLLRVCSNSDLSLYILLLTLFKLTAARSTGESEMTVLSPSYHRDDVVYGGNVVMFQDHIKISEDVRSNILETRRTVVGAYSNQATTLAEIHGLQLAEEIVSNHPFCLSTNIHCSHARPRQCPLELRFTRRESGILCTATYDAARLGTDLVADFCSNLEHFIEAASSDYAVPAEAVDWLRGARLDRVVALSKGRAENAPNANLCQLFAAQARKTPDANALIHGTRTVTYAELDAMAEVASRNFRDLGVEPGDTIVLRLPSGIETVAILLGAAKVGAAFAPVSPNEPARRLNRMLEKSRPRLLVSTDSELNLGTGLTTVQATQLFAPPDSLDPEHAAAVPTNASAYVIFTSGTSGGPKGVIIEHRGIVNAIAWKIREYELSTGHRVLPLFGYEFDGFVLNVFAPLCSGATVILIDDDDRRSPSRIAACIGSQRVTHVVTAPVLYDAVLDDISPHQLVEVQSVTLAGATADPETLVRGQRVGPHIRVSNEYGPTEASVVSTCRRDLTPDSVNVIGAPIDNVNAYILDARGNLAPPGVIGEIFLGGLGLARGYASSDSVTQESFVDSRGERLYQTGDLGRWLPEGHIEFHGRREGFVNLRGQRVDLEEIRAAILRCPGVKDAVVLYDAESSGGILSACVVLAPETTVDNVEAFLREELAASMIPNRLVPIVHLPLTAGGKVDLSALRAKLLETAAEEAELPSNVVEIQLMAIWRRVLETERIGLDDSFFSLGGHSLRAVRLLTEIHESFGVELRLDQVFSANTVRRLAAIIEPQQLQDPASGSQLLEERADGGDCDLSSAQERMVALANEHRTSYNLPVLFSLDGNVDLGRLESALEAVLKRHDSLRASFHCVNGRWVQRFSDTLTVTITERALPHLVEIEDVAQTALAPFDLETAPLFRVVLFAVEGKHAYLLFDFHHIIIDEVSLAVVLREIAMFYNGEPVQRASPHTYAAYSKAQQRRRASEDYQAQLDAAADKLRLADLEPLRLPFDYPAPRKRNHSGGVVRRELSREVLAAAQQFCANTEVTEFMFFMGVFALLLNKYTHQSSIVVGAPASLRTNVATRDLVGLCLNTVAFKIAVPSAAAFREYIREAAAGMIDELGRSHIEFDDVVKALQLGRHYGENPLFSVMLNVVDASVTRLPLHDCGTTYVPIHNGTSKFDLILELNLAEPQSTFSFEYSSERFRGSTIQRLSDSFNTLLEDIVARPDVPVSSLQVLGSGDLDQFVEWSGVKQAGTYAEGSVSALFERRVLERPSDVALIFGDEEITYGELNTRSNQLAHKLRSLGVGEDDLVAVFCERSPRAIVGVMAVQKAGAAHLPLDPFYPAARTHKMLSDSGARVLVADQDVSALQFSGTVINVDANLSGFSSENLGVSHRPESLAYVLYTSGTTGGPKGVMVAQRNLVTLVERATAHLSIGRRDVWTLFHSVCFDVSVWEMFGALLSGSRLVIVPREIAAFPERILDLVEKNAVTVLCQPPSAFYLLADEMVRAGRPTSIRVVVLGGEAVKTENLKQWSEAYPARLINGYGITETTVYSTFKEITGDAIRQRTGSIGRPVSGTYVYILDADLHPCPIGVTGELFIGGLGVGRGYRGEPELTRSRFIQDPFRPDGLLYRSGDLVRWLPNGEIEYLGRADVQVKVRGYRIELPEIEATMTSYSGIRESVVLAEPLGSTHQLIGFFISRTQEDLAQLRGYLEEQLPNYMVPARLVQIDSIPLTPNGKVDRAQLLNGRDSPPLLVTRPAMDKLEHSICNIWAEILGMPAAEIQVSHSFFALGGDSIGASLVVRVLSNLGFPVELVDLFENPVLCTLADVIRRRVLADADEGEASAAGRISYWSEVAAMKVPPLLPRSDAVAAPNLKIIVNVDCGSLRVTRVDDEESFDVSDVLLTALVVSLRIWSGASAFRVGLLDLIGDGSGTESPLVAPAVVVVRDVNLGRENLATVRTCARRAADHRLAWDEAMANPKFKATLEGGVLFHLGDFPFEHFDTAPSGCMLVTCVALGGDAEVTFAAPAGSTDPDRFRFLGEAFKLAFGQTLGALPAAPRSFRKARISLPVQPFQDVFFRDCTHQAVLAAVSYFGRDVRLPLANTMAVCVGDAARPHGLRVYMHYLERRGLEEVLGEVGLSVHRSFGTPDICKQLIECLSDGAVGVVKVDCYFVEQQQELYLTKHGDKTVVICGYDQDRSLFEMIDNDGARFMRYRRTTIGFDQLRAGHDGYQRTFNPHGLEVSSLTVSVTAGRHDGHCDDAVIRREALETLRLTHQWHSGEQSALAILHEDFCVASSSELLLMEHIEQLSFTLGEIVSAKRLLSYQMGRILKHSQLAQLVDEMIARFEIVYRLLAKLRESREYSAHKVDSMLAKLAETQQFHMEYAESISRFLEEE